MLIFESTFWMFIFPCATEAVVVLQQEGQDIFQMKITIQYSYVVPLKYYKHLRKYW